MAQEPPLLGQYFGNRLPKGMPCHSADIPEGEHCCDIVQVSVNIGIYNESGWSIDRVLQHRHPIRSAHDEERVREGCGCITGVATTTSGELRSVAAWTLRDKPPTTSATRMSVYCARLVIMLCTCAHVPRKDQRCHIRHSKGARLTLAEIQEWREGHKSSTLR